MRKTIKKIYGELASIRAELQIIIRSLELEKKVYRGKSRSARITIQYADNEIAQAEVRFCLSSHDWYEIQEKPFYQELMQYLDSLETPRNMQHQHESQD